MQSHYKKLENKKKGLLEEFRNHELSKKWYYDVNIASNKIIFRITRYDRLGYPKERKVELGLTDNLNFNTFLK